LTSTPAFVPGLAGIPAVESSISFIDGQVGILEYRGIPIEVLAEHSTFEETAYLLLYGSLPNEAELNRFRGRLSARRKLPDRLIETLRLLPGAGHPMLALQVGISILGMHSQRVNLKDRESMENAAIKIIGSLPSLVAAFERARKGLDFVQPKDGMDTAEAFLWMMSGEDPAPVAVRALDAALILHAEHTMNASTFTARVVASSESDPYSVCAAAVGSLKGPLHGGANERVLDQLEAIGEAENVRPWVEERLSHKGKVMGFGHRVYKTKDPRSKVLQKLGNQVFEKLGGTPMYELALELEKVMEEKVGAKGICPNVDFFSGLLYQKLEIATDLFTPIFAIARCSGYMAHWMEQMPNNRIFRPTQVYQGAREARYVPMSERK
jgi:citrate synthase